MMQQVPPLPPMPPAPDVIIHAGGNQLPPPAVVMIVLGGLAFTGLVLWPILRAIARRIERGGGGDPAELAELRQRVAELEERQDRMQELEERLDFTERLLAQQAHGTRHGEGERA